MNGLAWWAPHAYSDAAKPPCPLQVLPPAILDALSRAARDVVTRFPVSRDQLLLQVGGRNGR